MQRKQQVIKDLERVISLIETDSDQIPEEEKKRWSAKHWIILTITSARLAEIPQIRFF